MVKTKSNTEFMDWWKSLNEELVNKAWPECGFTEAKDCYTMGESPETAAQQLIVVWS